MRLERNTPEIPAGCPALGYGNTQLEIGADAHLYPRAADFLFDVHQTPGMGVVEVSACFTEFGPDLERSADDIIADTESLEVLADSDQGRRLLEFGQNPDARALVRTEFENRILNCPGVTDSGECWALGGTALEEVVLRLSLEQEG
jgi:hypothetical protein